MDYRKTAEEIYEKVGRRENLVSAAHCATRLRLVLADDAKCDVKAVEEIDGVKGVFSASGQLQIILGTGTVNKVYDEFLAVSGMSGMSKEEAKAAAVQKQPLFKRAIKTLGDIFVPIIPAIVASGFLMGIMEALNFMVNNGFLNLDTSGSLFTLANLFANTAYTFLPILIAFSAAKVFGGNPFLGAVIGMMMIHPNLQNAWTVATEGVHQTLSVWFGLYDVDLVGYQGHVIPVIIAVFVMCWIEKRLHKVVPAMFDLFVTPLASVRANPRLDRASPRYPCNRTIILSGTPFFGRTDIPVNGADFQAFALAGRRVGAVIDAPRARELHENLPDDAAETLDPRRLELRHEIRAVLIDDEAGQTVGFAKDEADGGRSRVERAARLHGVAKTRLEPALVDDVLLAEGPHAGADRRLGRIRRPRQKTTVLVFHRHRVTRGRMTDDLVHGGVVHPGVTTQKGTFLPLLENDFHGNS